MMAGIRSKSTQPELTIRKALHAQGFRYRLHPGNVPGHPISHSRDIGLRCSSTVVSGTVTTVNFSIFPLLGQNSGGKRLLEIASGTRGLEQFFKKRAGAP